MTPPFSIRSTPHYERLVRKLLKRHPELEPLHERVREILHADPYNQTRTHNIKKLEGNTTRRRPVSAQVGALAFSL